MPYILIPSRDLLQEIDELPLWFALVDWWTGGRDIKPLKVNKILDFI